MLSTWYDTSSIYWQEKNKRSVCDETMLTSYHCFHSFVLPVLTFGTHYRPRVRYEKLFCFRSFGDLYWCTLMTPLLLFMHQNVALVQWHCFYNGWRKSIQITAENSYVKNTERRATYAVRSLSFVRMNADNPYLNTFIIIDSQNNNSKRNLLSTAASFECWSFLSW